MHISSLILSASLSGLALADFRIINGRLIAESSSAVSETYFTNNKLCDCVNGLSDNKCHKHIAVLNANDNLVYDKFVPVAASYFRIDSGLCSISGELDAYHQGTVWNAYIAGGDGRIRATFHQSGRQGWCGSRQYFQKFYCESEICK